MRIIELTRGYQAFVDDEDFERVRQFNWSYSRDSRPGSDLIYAVANGLDRRIIRMHRFILGASRGILIDHNDRNGLNNQKRNLRVCTKAQNGFNQKMHRNNKTGLKGVSPVYKMSNKWQARIRINGRETYLGCFDSPEQAHEAYKVWCQPRHAEGWDGAFAVFSSAHSRLV